MSDAPPPATGSTDAPLVRGVLTIVLVGAALGIGFNALLLSSDPTRAIPWLRSERRVVRLEKVAGDSSRATARGTAGTVTMAPPAAGTTGSGTARAGTPDPAVPATGTARTGSAVPGSGAPHASAGPERVGGPRPANVPVSQGAAAAVGSTAPPAAAPGLPAIPESADPIEASLELLEKYHAAGAALVVDARSAEEYAEGHIPGAINLPFDDVFKHPEMVRTANAGTRPVFTYCGGGDCELSRSLAFSFTDAGLRRVLVFTGGLPAWKAAGHPVHTGAQP